jgi:hypothetical protein
LAFLGLAVLGEAQASARPAASNAAGCRLSFVENEGTKLIVVGFDSPAYE